MSTLPKISFGMIVLNGEPFLRYNLRALYPYAHQIIVVEGAAPGSRDVATPDGHSLDATVEILQRFQQEEDPENKLIVIMRDGFWQEKHEMSKAYAERATGDYLWQVDVDEFYLPESMERVLEMLRADSEITSLSFKLIDFWGAPDITVDGWRLRRELANCHRVFKWGENYRYITHRPPTVHNAEGQDLRDLKWLNAATTSAAGIYLYHYSHLFPKQIIEKSHYYANSEWHPLNRVREWADEGYLQLRHPYKVHRRYDLPSWLEYFHGKHPPQIDALWQDTLTGKTGVAPRHRDDVDRMLRSTRYALGRQLLKWLDYVHRVYFLRRVWAWIRLRVLQPLGLMKFHEIGTS
jgi:hypothetical protein